MEPQQHRPPLLDLPISIFRTRSETIPEGVTTLRRIVSREQNRPAIEAIRQEPDTAKQKEQKDQLRAFTSVSLLRHRKAATSFTDKITSQWPMLAGDVDKGDNPGVKMADLKAKICLLRYVLLCAYSVRGGLWFVVRLPEGQTPETLAAHFRYLQRLFSEQFGVTLDSSKGGNPTDLRYVSYDAAPYINDAAEVMPKTYTPPKPKPVRRDYRPATVSGEWELNQVVRLAQEAGKGNRHGPLLKAGTLAGGYIGAGRLDHDTAVYALETIASELDNFRDSQRAISDGIKHGLQKPLYAEPTYEPPRQHQPGRGTARPKQVRVNPVVAPTPETSATSAAARQHKPQKTDADNSLQTRFLPTATEPVCMSSTPSAKKPVIVIEPTPPGAKPCKSASEFHQWQQQHRYFGRHGIASLKPQQ